MERIVLSSIHMPRHKEAGESSRKSFNLEQIMGAMTKLKIQDSFEDSFSKKKKPCAEHFGQIKWVAELGKH